MAKTFRVTTTIQVKAKHGLSAKRKARRIMQAAHLHTVDNEPKLNKDWWHYTIDEVVEVPACPL